MLFFSARVFSIRFESHKPAASPFSLLWFGCKTKKLIYNAGVFKGPNLDKRSRIWIFPSTAFSYSKTRDLQPSVLFSWRASSVLRRDFCCCKVISAYLILTIAERLLRVFSTHASVTRGVSRQFRGRRTPVPWGPSHSLSICPLSQGMHS